MFTAICDMKTNMVTDLSICTLHLMKERIHHIFCLRYTVKYIYKQLHSASDVTHGERKKKTPFFFKVKSTKYVMIKLLLSSNPTWSFWEVIKVVHVVLETLDSVETRIADTTSAATTTPQGNLYCSKSSSAGGILNFLVHFLFCPPKL